MGNFYHTNNLWDNWSHLTESVIKGHSAVDDEDKSDGDDWVESFIGAMHYRGVHQGKILAMMIDLTNVKTILDVGGGSAAFSIEIVKRNPAIAATVFDLPYVIPLTKRYVSEAGLLDKFNFIEGNYLTREFEGNYDLILLSAIVHINNYEQNKALIKKCTDALNKNGMIVISDFIMSNDRTKPYHGALFSLNMLVGTKLQCALVLLQRMAVTGGDGAAAGIVTGHRNLRNRASATGWVIFYGSCVTPKSRQP